MIRLMKDELGEQFMKDFVGLRSKICSHLKDNNEDDKKAKGTIKCVIKRNLKFEIFKYFLGAAQI